MTRDETIIEDYAQKELHNDVRTINDMLEYKRPHMSKSERRFINRFIRPLGAEPDQFGNYILRVGSEAPTVLFSAHTDSVHRTAGRQRVVLGGGHFKLSQAEKQSSCLGADNAAGVWLLTELIKAGVPGLYVFHRNEESGCVGSKHIAEKTPEILEGIQAAIAFDRRGTKSIITHQMGRRTCSDTFAKSLGSLLSLGHALDDGGSYTDTNSYRSIIPECTNVSVGYTSEHSSMETLNLGYLLLLKMALVRADFSKLECVRDPKVIELDDDIWGRNHYGRYGGWAWDDDRQPSMYSRTVYTKKTYGPVKSDDLFDLVREWPDEVADYLELMGVDPAEIIDHIEQIRGYDTCGN